MTGDGIAFHDTLELAKKRGFIRQASRVVIAVATVIIVVVTAAEKRRATREKNGARYDAGNYDQCTNHQPEERPVAALVGFSNCQTTFLISHQLADERSFLGGILTGRRHLW